MKLRLIYLFILLNLFSNNRLTAQWTWMNGDTITNSPAVKGTSGVPGVLNTPGAFYGGYHWNDLNGNLWVYSIYEGFGSSDELWKYDPVSNMWTHLRGLNSTTSLIAPIYGTIGIPSPNNTPGSERAGGNTWVDNSGNLWLLSSNGATWKYTIASNEWTCMKANSQASYGTKGVVAGSNSPGLNRFECSNAWKDKNGDLWFISGTKKNDVWRYETGSNNWVWEAGDTLIRLFSNHGTMGISSPNNAPAFGRSNGGIYTGWNDVSKNDYYFRADFDPVLWKFNTVQKEYTWVSGSDTARIMPVFGENCKPSTKNQPENSVHEGRAAVKDACNNFWLMNPTSIVWKYKPTTNEWTWVYGDTTKKFMDVFGIKGIDSPNNHPETHSFLGSVAVFNKGIYVFGGIPQVQGFPRNIVWRYAPQPIPKFNYAVMSCGKIKFTDQSEPECGGDLQSWFWIFGDGTTSTLQHPEHQYASSGTYNVQLIVKNCLDISDTLVQQVNDSGATYTFTNTITNATCTTNTGSATITVTPSATYTYSWSPAVSALNTANDLAPGIYIVEIKDTTGCAVKDTIKITNGSNLDAKIKTIQSANCATAGSAELNVSGGTSPFIFSWSPGGAMGNPVSLGVGTYTATVTDANGCKDTVQLNIKESGTSISAQSNTVNLKCYESKDGSITVFPNNGTGPYTFTWSPNVSTISSSVNLTAGNYVVNIKDANGCSGSITVSLTEPPQLSTNLSVSPTNLCLGQQSTLSAQTTGGTGAYTYTWLPGAQTGATISVSPTATTNYSCVVNDANNCKDTASVTVTIDPTPLALFKTDTAICVGQQVIFNDLSTISTGAISSWLWTFGDGGTAAQQNPSHTFNTAGKYTLSLTVSNGVCSNTYTKNNAVQVYARPKADFSYIHTGGGAVDFTDLSGGAAIWSWNFGDQTGSNLQHPNHVYSIETTDIQHAVTLTVFTELGNCKDSTTKEIIIQDFGIYLPNSFSPNNDGTNDVFTAKGTGIKESELYVFNRWGEEIYHEQNTGIIKGWNGIHNDKKAQEEVYVYVFIAKDYGNKDHRFKGTITLVR